MASSRNNGRSAPPAPLDLSTTNHNNQTRTLLHTRLEHEASGPRDQDDPTPSCHSTTQSTPLQMASSSAAQGPLRRAENGILLKAPIQDVVDNGKLLSPDQSTPVVQVEYAVYEHVDVKHADDVQLRIQRLHPKERQIVTMDGGNTVDSQVHVLETLEGQPVDENNSRAWTMSRVVLEDGTEQTQYRCKAQDRNTGLQCPHISHTPQKARQHFVSCAVDISCWTCPFQDDCGAPKYKRLDDLKHHHIQPVHQVLYSRPRGGGSASRRKSAPSSSVPEPPSTHDAAAPLLSPEQDLPSSSSAGVIRSAPGKARKVRKTLAAGPSTTRSTTNKQKPPRVKRDVDPVMTMTRTNTVEEDEEDTGAPPHQPTSSTSPYPGPGPVATSSVSVSPLTTRQDFLSPTDHRQTWTSRPSLGHAHAQTYPPTLSHSLSPADIGHPLLSPSVGSSGGVAVPGFPSGPTIRTAPSSPFGEWLNLSVGSTTTYMPAGSSSSLQRTEVPPMNAVVDFYSSIHRGGPPAPHVRLQDGIPGNDPPASLSPADARWPPQLPAAAWNNVYTPHPSQIQQQQQQHGMTNGYAYNAVHGAGPSARPPQRSPTSPSPYHGTAPGVGPSSYLSPTSPLMFTGHRRGSGNVHLSPYDYTTPGLSGSAVSSPAQARFGNVTPDQPAPRGSGERFPGPSIPTLPSPSDQAVLDIIDASHEQPSLYPDLFDPDSDVHFSIAPSSANPLSPSYPKAAEEPHRF